MNWPEFAQAAGPQALQAFRQVWFERRWLNTEQEKILRDLFEKYPLGQTSFKVWLKNTTRNLLAQETSRMIANNGIELPILNKA